MNNVKELMGFGIFAALAGFSFGAVFFGIAFVYKSINHQQDISMTAVAAIIFGIVGVFVGITQSNKKRQSISV
ncbi:hypothetical protein [Vibrio alfacsensis]|uniref:hypothetical protein n=1 Tax=Vibrio alfacsensis TaxID=1074311 RepID=UPI0040679432